MQYVDDFLGVDLRSAGQSAGRALLAVTRRAGFVIEKKKHKPHRPVNQGLGAEADLSQVVHDGIKTEGSGTRAGQGVPRI